MAKLINSIQIYLIYISIFSILETTIWAQKLSIGSCPTIEPMADIHLRRYMGLWYQYSSIRPVWKKFKKCVKFKYAADKNGAFYVQSSYKILGNDKLKIHYGVAKPMEYHGLPQEADFRLQYFNWFRNATKLTNGSFMPLYILDTDYENYAVEYSCTEVGFLKILKLHILVRNLRVNSAHIVRQALQSLESTRTGDIYKYLKLTNQKKCT